MSSNSDDDFGAARNDPGLSLDPDALNKRLKDLLDDDALNYVDLELVLERASEEVRQKHNARTARYKDAQALRGAPDSEAVRHALSHIMLRVLGRNDPSSHSLFSHAMRELTGAGYDQEESRASIVRLQANRDELHAKWQQRTRQKLSRAIVRQLRSLKA